MIKILLNENPTDADISVKLTLNEGSLRADVETDDMKSFDVIEKLLPYNSYSLVANPNGGGVKIDGQFYTSSYKWLNMNRLGVAIRMDFCAMAQLYSPRTLLQVDTGVTDSDIVIRLFSSTKDKLAVESDQEYELGTFTPEEFMKNGQPRYTLWDGYSLTAGGIEYKADCDGNFISKEIPSIPAGDVIDFTITKYTSDFETKLVRDIDCEEVFVDSSVGVADNRRVRLENGVGHFKLITFGYTGSVKLKLGRKWYEVWNDYALTIQ